MSFRVVHIQLFVSNVPLPLNRRLVVRHYHPCAVDRSLTHNGLLAWRRLCTLGFRARRSLVTLAYVLSVVLGLKLLSATHAVACGTQWRVVWHSVAQWCSSSSPVKAEARWLVVIGPATPKEELDVRQLNCGLSVLAFDSVGSTPFWRGWYLCSAVKLPSSASAPWVGRSRIIVSFVSSCFQVHGR